MNAIEQQLDRHLRREEASEREYELMVGYVKDVLGEWGNEPAERAEIECVAEEIEYILACCDRKPQFGFLDDLHFCLVTPAELLKVVWDWIENEPRRPRWEVAGHGLCDEENVGCLAKWGSY